MGGGGEMVLFSRNDRRGPRISLLASPVWGEREERHGDRNMVGKTQDLKPDSANLKEFSRSSWYLQK